MLCYAVYVMSVALFLLGEQERLKSNIKLTVCAVMNMRGRVLFVINIRLRLLFESLL